MPPTIVQVKALARSYDQLVLDAGDSNNPIVRENAARAKSCDKAIEKLRLADWRDEEAARLEILAPTCYGIIAREGVERNARGWRRSACDFRLDAMGLLVDFVPCGACGCPWDNGHRCLRCRRVRYMRYGAVPLFGPGYNEDPPWDTAK